jgi:hypothetical protein
MNCEKGVGVMFVVNAAPIEGPWAMHLTIIVIETTPILFCDLVFSFL